MGLDLDHLAEDAKLLSAVSSENRLKTFVLLLQGRSPKQVADQLDLRRASIQPYLNDFKENQLFETEGKEYRSTEKAEKVAQLIQEIDRLHSQEKSEELEQLMERINDLKDEELDIGSEFTEEQDSS